MIALDFWSRSDSIPAMPSSEKITAAKLLRMKDFLLAGAISLPLGFMSCALLFGFGDLLAGGKANLLGGLWLMLTYGLPATAIAIPLAWICSRLGYVRLYSSYLAGASIGSIVSIVEPWVARCYFSLQGEIWLHFGQGATCRLEDYMFGYVLGLPYGIVCSSVFWLALRQIRPEAFQQSERLNIKGISKIIAGSMILAFLCFVIALIPVGFSFQGSKIG